MFYTDKELSQIDKLISLAIEEDCQDIGDITSAAIFTKKERSKAYIISKSRGIIACSFIVERVYKQIDKDVKVSILLGDGQALPRRSVPIISIDGPVISILLGERIALNFLSHLSGIATITREFVDKIKGSGAYILDTRKTTPGMRVLEKRAVLIGGGLNHRMGLYDKVLIKDNHIDASGGISSAINSVRSSYGDSVFIEVEVRSVSEAFEALSCNVHRILLDNMSIEDMKQVVGAMSGKVELEASGGVSLANVSKIAQAGVDFISIGCITSSSSTLDLSLLFKE